MRTYTRKDLHPGDRIADLELLEDLGLRVYCGQRVRHWLCRCLLCGGEVAVPQKNLGTAQKDCGCRKRRPRKPIPPGTRFGRLTVLEPLPGEGRLRYRLRCDCGNETTATRANLLSGSIQSCGCLHDELFQTNSAAYREKNLADGTTYSHMAHMETLHRNNTSGIRGVTWHKGNQKWQARISYRGKAYSLGYYSDKDEAGRAVEEAREKIRADFERWKAQQAQPHSKKEKG